MIRSLAAKLILLLIAAVVSSLLYLAFRNSAIQVAAAPAKKTGSSTMSISGFGFSIYEGAALKTRVQADQFQIVPRKFGIFRMKSINEASLTKARFEIYSDRNGEHAADGRRNEKGAAGVFSALGDEFNARTRGVPGIQGVGNVTRLVMDGMELAFCREDTPYLVARARNGAMDFKKKEIRMRGAVLEHLPAKKQIAGDTIFWDDRAQVFKIPGNYETLTPRGRVKGRGITVDLDFHVKKMTLGGN